MTIQGGTVDGSSGGLVISTSGVTVSGMTLRGPGYSSDRGHIAIQVTGGSATSYVQNVNLTHNTISGWDGEGIHAEFVDGFDVSDNDISNIWYAGIGMSSVQHGTINRNWVHNIIGTGNAYGIYLSRGYGGGLTSNPRSSNVQVDSNTIEDIPNWEGLDTHAGQHLQFTNNTIRRVLNPIMIGACPETSGGTQMFAPLDVTVSGNTMSSGRTDGSVAGEAIYFGGANGGSGVAGSSNELATGSITNNTITGYGLESSGEYSAIKVSDTSGLQIRGNRINQPSPAGIQIYLNNYDFSVTGNTITDAWSDSLTYAFGIYVHVDYNTGTVSGNTFTRSSKTARSVMTSNVEVNGYAHNSVTVQ
jgi:hypothetical protein